MNNEEKLYFLDPEAGDGAVFVGLSLGRNPAASFLQVTSSGFRVLRMVNATDTGVTRFMQGSVNPTIAEALRRVRSAGMSVAGGVLQNAF